MKEFYKKLEFEFFQKNYRSWQVFLIYLFLAFIAFSPSFLNLDFFWDDERFIFSNPEMLQSPGFFAFWNINSVYFKSWPLGYSTFWTLINYSPFQSFIFYKLINILVHSLNALILFKILRKFHQSAAFPVSLLFLFHPLAVESVSWIFQLLTLLSFTLFFISFSFCMKLFEKNKLIDIFLSFIFFALSLLMKSNAILGPFFLTIFFWTKKAPLRRYILLIPFFIASGYIGYLNQYGTFLSSAQSHAKIPFVEYVNQALRSVSSPDLPKLKHDIDKAYFDFTYQFKKIDLFTPNYKSIFFQSLQHYPLKVIAPFRLHFVYPKEYNLAYGILGFLFLLLLPIFISRKLKDRSVVLLYGIGFSFLAPFSGLTFITFFYWSQVSDRYAYFFLVYLCLVLMFMIQIYPQYFKKIILTSIFVFGITCFIQGFRFNDPLLLYKDSLEIRNHPVFYALLIDEYIKNLNLEEAEKIHQEALVLYPKDHLVKMSALKIQALRNNLKQLEP